MWDFEQNEMNEEQMLPWLIFRIGEELYAINSSYISYITMKSDELTKVPDMNPACFGLMPYQGGYVTIISLRTLFGMVTLEQEYDKFQVMIEDRKQDHLHWVEELERSVREHSEFHLAVDPHQCAFGKWYDNFESEQLSVNNHLSKIDLPHKQLHQCAEKVMRCYSENGDLDWPCAEGVLEQLDKKIVPQIVKLLDETKEIFSNYFREMIIVLENKDERIGLIVDEVLSVDDLEMMESNLHINQDIRCSVYMTDVAKFHHNDQMVYLLDGEKLIHYE